MSDPVEQKAEALNKKGGGGLAIAAILGAAGLAAVGLGVALSKDKESTSIVQIPEQERTRDERSQRPPLLTGQELELVAPAAVNPSDSLNAEKLSEIEKLVGELANNVDQNSKFQQQAIHDMERRLDRLSARNSAGSNRRGDTEREQELARAKAAEEQRLESQILVLDAGKAPAVEFEATATDETMSAFLSHANNRTVRTVHSTQLEETHRLLTQGTIIPAVLETAISSDLPGNIKARVRRDVWSADGSTLLVKKGATLLGVYDANTEIGDTRILVAWTRLVTTDQRTIDIGSPGTDGRGVAGFSGHIDHHFPEKFEAAAFISIFKGLSNIMTAQIVTAGSRGASSGIEDGGDAATDSMEEYLSIPPTIWIDQGAQVNVLVNRDLYFSAP